MTNHCHQVLYDFGLFHCWEKQYITDRLRTGQKHNQTVNPNTKSTSWWHAVFEGFDEIVVDTGCFVISQFLGLGLGFEAFQLVDWIVQFGKGIAVLLGHDKEFKAVSEAGVLVVFLRQRRYFDWMAKTKVG